jgi:hypothetical protein
VFYYFSVAAYRPERSDDDILQLHDMGWLPFTGIIYTITLQNVVIAIAVLTDERTRPIFPRWFGYISLWLALLYLPDCLDVYFKDGPLDWGGVLSLWLSLVAYFLWIVAATVLMLRAVAEQERTHSGGPDGDQAENRDSDALTVS